MCVCFILMQITCESQISRLQILCNIFSFIQPQIMFAKSSLLINYAKVKSKVLALIWYQACVQTLRFGENIYVFVKFALKLEICHRVCTCGTASGGTASGTTPSPYTLRCCNSVGVGPRQIILGRHKALLITFQMIPNMFCYLMYFKKYGRKMS